MLKPLTFSLSLALALGFCSVSMAGGHDDNCTTCGLASAQGGPYATGQGVAGCDPAVRPKKHCFSFHLPKIHCNFPKLVHTCSYEWVLKKKHNFCFKHEPKCDNGGCARPAASTRQARAALLLRASTALLRRASTVLRRVRSTALASMPSRLRSRRLRSPRPLPR